MNKRKSKTVTKNGVTLKTENEIMREKALDCVGKLLNVSERFATYWQKQLDSTVKTNDPTDKHEKPEDKVIINLNYAKGLKLEDLKGTLREYQMEGVTWMNTLFLGGINGILADEMGLGKTIQVIAFIGHLLASNVNGPFLIVAPLSTLENWRSEFQKFLPTISVVVFHGDQTERETLKHKITVLMKQQKSKVVVILSYQTVARERNFLITFKWKYNIIDEAQRIKNHNTILSMVLREIPSENKLLLTGTPLQNNMTELWALLNFIMPQIFNKVDAFSSLLALEDFEDGNTIAETNTLPIITKIHKILSPFMLRRLKKNVLDDMVPKKEVLLFCTMTETQKEMYSKILSKTISDIKQKKSDEDDKENVEKNIVGGFNLRKRKNVDYKVMSCKSDDEEEEYELYELDEPDEPDSKRRRTDNSAKVVPFTDKTIETGAPDYMHHVNMSNPVMMYRRVVDHPFLISMPFNAKTREIYIDEKVVTESGKMLVLDALLHKLKEEGHKVLIFSTLVIMLNLIEEYMNLRQFKYRRLDGALDLATRQAYVDDFNKDSDILAFLISTRAGGVGINLTSADTVIMFDNDWNPQADIQAQDRCHRIGQTKPVLIYKLVMKNSIDETIIKRGEMKRRLEKLVIKDGKVKAEAFLQDYEEHARLLESNVDKIVIHPNGFVLSDDELNNILDRSELIKEMKENRKTHENKAK